jgi:dolichyl-phosphate beta-glucosyltransferase
MTLAVVVPCFDEAHRLDLAGLAALVDVADRVVFVDDGSTDATAARLGLLATTHPDRFEVVRLPRNLGKAEAVRHGLHHVIAGHDVVGYFDADLATPVTELGRLAAVLAAQPDCQAVLASRVALLGHHVERHAARHYLGRVYATAASLVLGIPVYDTQCGAKLFRVGPALNAALAQPFPDRWAFDVELLARLLRPAPGTPPVRPDQLVEVPLREWRDVGGSKLRPASAARSLVALAGVRRRMRARRPD